MGHIEVDIFGYPCFQSLYWVPSDTSSYDDCSRGVPYSRLLPSSVSPAVQYALHPQCPRCSVGYHLKPASPV